jgi:DNA-binding transcriptional LysR family regulator
MLAVSARSDMIATVPERLAHQYADALELQVLPFPVAVPPVPVYMLWSSALDRDPAHRWLRQQLTDSAATEPAP